MYSAPPFPSSNAILKQTEMCCLSSVFKLASAAMAEDLTGTYCFKDNSGCLLQLLWPGCLRLLSGGGFFSESGKGSSGGNQSRGRDDERKRVDESLKKVMFLNCWAQS